MHPIATPSSAPVHVRGRFALVGPGRAGTSVALALVGAGWRPVAVSGRTTDAPSTRTAVARFGVPAVATAAVGAGAGLVVIATPDAAIDDTARELAPGLESDALVVHLSGARGLDALAAITELRPACRVGALHPLQTFAAPDPARVAGAWAAVAGPPAVADLARDLGLHPFVVDDDRRAAYHAAAVVASNHLVALLGQVERLADAAGVPFDAFMPLVATTLANCAHHGPMAALTGPVARGDAATVDAHLGALPEAERDTYRALALAALVLSGRDDADLRALLQGVPA
jgi:predicted short-subunit dehydrogenase-like oxidoreductase (DUF2520 family)